MDYSKGSRKINCITLYLSEKHILRFDYSENTIREREEATNSSKQEK